MISITLENKIINAYIIKDNCVNSKKIVTENFRYITVNNADIKTPEKLTKKRIIYSEGAPMLIKGDTKRCDTFCIIESLGDDNANVKVIGFKNTSWQVHYSDITYCIKENFSNFIFYAKNNGYKIIKNLENNEEWIVPSNYKTINGFKVISIILPGTFSRKRKSYSEDSYRQLYQKLSGGPSGELSSEPSGESSEEPPIAQASVSSVNQSIGEPSEEHPISKASVSSLNQSIGEPSEEPPIAQASVSSVNQSIGEPSEEHPVSEDKIISNPKISVDKLLNFFKLEIYIPKFKELGFNDISILYHMKKKNYNKFEDICCKHLNMLYGHFVSFDFFLDEYSYKFI